MQKIVVIDDEKDVTLLMKKSLERTGQYTVFTAFDSTEGEQVCLQEKPDLLFLDFILPDGHGDDLLKKLRKVPELRNMAVVMMTGLGEMSYFDKNEKWRWLPNKKVVQDRGEIPDEIKWHLLTSEEVASQLGVSVYLRKPFSKETLAEVAAEVFAKKEQETQQKKEDDL